jgi:hypothetical protein
MTLPGGISIDPADVQAMTPEQASAALAQLSAILPLLIARAAARPAAEPVIIPAQPQSSDALRSLTLPEMATAIGKPLQWVKRNARKLPGAIKTGRTWSFRAVSVEKYLKLRELAYKGDR